MAQNPSAEAAPAADLIIACQWHDVTGSSFVLHIQLFLAPTVGQCHLTTTTDSAHMFAHHQLCGVPQRKIQGIPYILYTAQKKRFSILELSQTMQRPTGGYQEAGS